MLHRIALALFVLLMPLAAHAQSIEGSWDFRIGDTAIFRFDIERTEDGEWLGQWHRPDSFNTDGNNFTNMRGPVKTSPSMTGIEFLGQVELSFDDPRPGAIPDIFRFELLDGDRAEMTYVGTGLAPYRLVRAQDGEAFGEWDANRIYRRRLPDEEVPEIFDPGVQSLPPLDPVDEADRLDSEEEATSDKNAGQSRIQADFLDGL